MLAEFPNNPDRAQACAGGRLMPNAIVAVCAALALWSSTAMAQQSRADAAHDRIVARQCEVDLRARCDVTSAGRDGIRACVKQQFASLEGECRTWLARLAAINKACAADIKQNCADVKGGRGRVEACLKSALGSLSDNCKDALATTVSRNR